MRRLNWIMLCVVALLASTARAQSTVSVMPLGDSITAGTVAGGYRKPMVDKLKTFGLTVTTVGTQKDKSLDIAQQPHEGHGGWRIDQLCDNLLGVNPVDSSAHGGYWLCGGHGTGRDAVHPQFVTVMAGINDINNFLGKDLTNPMSQRTDQILKTLEDRQSKLVQTLTEQLPDASILLTGCIPYNNGLLDDHLTGATPANRKLWARQDGVSEQAELGVNHYVILFNKWIKDIYVPHLQAKGKKVDWVNTYADFILPDGSVRSWSNKPPENTNGPAGYGDYGLHPNDFGYKLIGQTLADAIHQHLTK
jgi:lysophospholipase L1-like esterase